MSTVGASFNRDPSECQIDRSDVIATLGKGKVSVVEPGTERGLKLLLLVWAGCSQGGAEMDFLWIHYVANHLSISIFIFTMAVT